MSGPFDAIYGLRPDLATLGQPDPIAPDDIVRFLGQNQAQAMEPELAPLALASQEQPMPNDFWARLAQGSGPTPFGQPQLGNKFTGLEALLAFATGLGNAKATQGARRVSEADQRNARARESAKDLANKRWEMRKIAAQSVDRNAQFGANEQFRRDKMAQDAAKAALDRGDREAWRRILNENARDRIDISRERAGVGAGGGGGADGANAHEVWAKRLQTGEVKLSQVPQALRTGVLQTAGTILPEKARLIVNDTEVARGLVGQLRELSAKIPRGEGMGRFKTGLQSTAAGVAQSEGVGEAVANYNKIINGSLAKVVRALGESGALATKDIDRIKQSIPSVYDTDPVSLSAFDNLESIFSEVAERSIKSYTTDMGNAGAGRAAPPGTPTAGKDIEWVMDANGVMVRK